MPFDAPICIDTRPIRPSPRIDGAEQDEDDGLSLIALQQRAMRQVFQQAGISLASYALEVVTVARAAAANGEYGAASSLYKIVGQHIGALSDLPAQHVHLHADGRPADLRATSDDQLRALIARARGEQTNQCPAAPTETTRPAEVLSIRSTPATP